jgi:hypothetical protein
MGVDDAEDNSRFKLAKFDDAERSVVPERDLNNANLYPEITSGDLPYNEDKPVVIDSSAKA